jgi:hypothetical protein
MEDLKIERTDEMAELSEVELEEVAGGFFDWTAIALTQANVNVGPSLYTTQSNAAAIIVH